MTDRGTDTRKFNFFIIENEVIDNYKLSAGALALYVVIVRYADRDTNEAFPSISELMDALGMSRMTVIKYTAELEKKGLIRVERKKKEGTKENEVNHYFVLDVKKQRGVVQNLDHVVQNLDCNKKSSREDKNELETKPSSSSSFNRISQIYKDNIGRVTGIIDARLTTALNEYGETWVTEAIDLAVGKERRSIFFVESILKQWRDNGKWDEQGQPNTVQDEPEPEPDCAACNDLGWQWYDIDRLNAAQAPCPQCKPDEFEVYVNGLQEQAQ